MTEGEQPAARPKLRYKNRGGYKPVKTGPKPKAPKHKPSGRPRGRKDGNPEAHRNRSVGNAWRQAKLINPNLEANAFTGNALALFQAVYKDPDQPTEARIDAAKAAIPYESKRLQATDINGTVGVVTHEEALKRLAGKK